MHCLLRYAPVEADHSCTVCPRQKQGAVPDVSAHWTCGQIHAVASLSAEGHRYLVSSCRELKDHEKQVKVMLRNRKYAKTAKAAYLPSFPDLPDE